MAQATLPSPTVGRSWLDNPLTPRWQRLAAFAINWEIAAYGTLVLAGFLLRIWDVGSRAMHHDESLHAYYAWQFFHGGGYSYNPLMHGPFQFEVVPIFYLLFGDNELAARLLPAVLGTILIFLPYFLRRYLTPAGALLASVVLTISPAFVYFSRFIRDDIYLAAFSLLIFICIVRYIEEPRPYWLYIGAAAMALAMASMEAAYITFFIFGTFLIFQAIREWLGRPGPVIPAVRATPLDTWLTALAVFVVLTVLFYSTFFTNPNGIWDTKHSLTSPDRTDILGGLTYWKAQHAVERGGQPWFYYLLVVPLYEQVGLLFGAAGIVLSAFQRSLFRTFLVWWAVMSFALYTWAGEKMPWLSIHIALPLIVLAGLFVGDLLRSRRSTTIIGAGAVLAALLTLEVHSTFMLNFINGANPTEMLIYVQTSQDVPNVANEISKIPNWPNVSIGLDNTDVGGWPFTWYLRHDPKVSPTSVFNAPACNGQYCSVLLMLGPEFDKYGPQLAKQYVVQKYRWNWWFPEDYKVWFPAHWGAFWSGRGATSDLLGTRHDWHNVWNWLVYRQPFGDRAARDLYVLVRRDLVPGAKYFSTTGPVGSGPTASTVPALSTSLLRNITKGKTPLYGPRGIGADGKGNLYVADTLNHRVVVFDPSGGPVRSWGTGGAAPGQFSPRDSPQSLATGPDGLVYVTDTWNQRIQVFSHTGQFIRQWGGGPVGSGPQQFYGPRSIAVATSGRVYVADTGNERIQVFSNTGTYLSSIGTAGSGPGQFTEPSSVAVDRHGHVYVADYWNQRIQVFTESGKYVTSWRVPDWVPKSYDEPYLAVDPQTDVVFATDPAQRQVLKFSKSGQVVGAIRDASLSMPIGVAVLKHGGLAVTDPNANQVSIFSVPTSRSHRTTSRENRAARSIIGTKRR